MEEIPNFSKIVQDREVAASRGGRAGCGLNGWGARWGGIKNLIPMHMRLHHPQPLDHAQCVAQSVNVACALHVAWYYAERGRIADRQSVLIADGAVLLWAYVPCSAAPHRPRIRERTQTCARLVLQSCRVPSRNRNRSSDAGRRQRLSVRLPPRSRPVPSALSLFLQRPVAH